MGQIIPERMAAEIEGDFVVFIIGMRVNRPWKLHKWVPVFLAMPRMLKELKQQPESGFLGSISGGLLIVQYWRSFEHLEAYARSHDHSTGPRGSRSTSVCARAGAMSESGMKPMSFGPDNTRRFIAACRVGAWAAWARLFRRRAARNLLADG